MARKTLIILTLAVFSIPFLSHADDLVFTDPAIYGIHNGNQGGCCENFVVASVVEHAPEAFEIVRIEVDNRDFSLNNHAGMGNMQAWIYDSQNNLLAASTNTCYVQGGCLNLYFEGQSIPATFILVLGGHDMLQGYANFTISNIRFYKASVPVGIVSGTLQQYESDATSTISEGGMILNGEVVFSASLQSSGAGALQLQVELKGSGLPFIGEANVLSPFVPSGSFVTADVSNLYDDEYRWRARAVDSLGNASAWQEFGTAGNIDFVVAREPVIIVP
ncbi:MAG: hypothetical protein AAB602_02735, partial [Patescibacteria group bacterium]